MPLGIKTMLQREDKKDEVINEHGEAKYKEMLAAAGGSLTKLCIRRKPSSLTFWMKRY
jgi:hypothetical protein